MNLVAERRGAKFRSLHGLFLAALLLSMSASKADNLTEINNRLAIADVLAQYSYRWDGKDSLEFSRLFTENAIMERWLHGEYVDGSRLEGREAIFDYAKQSHEGRLVDRQSRHHFSGLVFLELKAATAITENMVLITHQTENDTAAVIRSSGIYRNTWRKTPEGWRISKRILMTDRFRN
jgi:hypothetical protein